MSFSGPIGLHYISQLQDSQTCHCLNTKQEKPQGKAEPLLHRDHTNTDNCKHTPAAHISSTLSLWQHGLCVNILAVIHLGA